MKNFLPLIFALMCSILSICSMSAQTKQVYWVHGLNKNYTSFENFANYFSPLYYLSAHRGSYTTNVAIPSSAASLKGIILSSSTQANIVIAHSMGGVNSMYIYKNLGGRNYIGGLISLNSLYNGAYVTNNIDNGTMVNIVNEAVDLGAKGARNDPGVAVATFLTVPVIDVATALGIYHTVLETLIGKIPNYVKTFDTTPFVATATKNSLKVGSSDIVGIQGGGSDLPSIAFFGNEDYPASLKLIKSTTNQDIESLVSGVSSGCNSLYNYHHLQYLAMLASLNFPVAAFEAQMASNWKTSKDYWSGTFQKATNIMIGAYRTEQQEVTYREWLCVSEDGPHKKSISNVEPCVNQWVYFTEMVDVIIDEPSDGLLPISTQKALPGCIRTYELLHINHEEATSHPDVRARLRDVFIGTINTTRNPSFFTLTPK